MGCDSDERVGSGGADAGARERDQWRFESRDASELETRMLQLIESTAVAAPGPVRASEPVKQNGQMTFATMERNPNPALLYQFINQVKAYLALSESSRGRIRFRKWRTGNSRSYETISSGFGNAAGGKSAARVLYG